MRIESVVDLAKRHMELWIIKGEYEPGQKLKEEENLAQFRNYFITTIIS